MAAWCASSRASSPSPVNTTFTPVPVIPAPGWEKGKVEKSVAYLRSNFWPLRSFTDLADVNRQVRQWLAETANVRLHRETRQHPCDRFRPDTLRPLPALAPDYRDTAEVFVYKDLRWHFDANRYYAPPRCIEQHLIAKADASSVTLYDRQGVEIVRYPRCWRRGQTLGGERFEKELLDQRPAARRSQAQQRLLKLLHGVCPPARFEAFCAGWPTPTVRSSASFRNSSICSALIAPNRSPRPSKKPLPPALSAPITWPISYTRSTPLARFSPPCSCATRNSINSPPTRCPCSTTMPSS